jgi:hypothetical protein
MLSPGTAPSSYRSNRCRNSRPCRRTAGRTESSRHISAQRPEQSSKPWPSSKSPMPKYASELPLGDRGPGINASQQAIRELDQSTYPRGSTRACVKPSSRGEAADSLVRAALAHRGSSCTWRRGPMLYLALLHRAIGAFDASGSVPEVELHADRIVPTKSLGLSRRRRQTRDSRQNRQSQNAHLNLRPNRGHSTNASQQTNSVGLDQFTIPGGQAPVFT